MGKKQTRKQDNSDYSDTMVMEVLTTAPEYEEIVQLRANYVNQELALANILEAENAGELDSDESDNLVAQAIEDHADGQAQILGLERDFVSVEMGQQDIDNADFAATFGQVLANLIDAEYQNVDDGIVDLSTASGLAPEIILGIVDGSYAPDISKGMGVLEKMASVFDSLQQEEQAYQEFLELGTQAYQQVAQTAQMGSSETIVEMSAYDQLQAQFNELQQKEAVSEALRFVERECDRGLTEGWLFPVEARNIRGEFERTQDYYAAFSAMCSNTNTTEATQLDRWQYFLYMAEQRGPLVQFGAAVETISDADVESVSPEIEAEATSYRSRNGYQ